MSLKDLIQSLANSTLAFQQEMKSSIQNLENQMSQLATLVSKLESQGKLPFQSVPNPKQNASVITLQSGKELESASPKRLAQGSTTNLKVEAEIKILAENQPKKLEVEQPLIQVIHPPFPERFAQSKREMEEKEILEIFCKVQIKTLFAISCKVGNLEVKKAMCDFEASINVMPLSVNLSLDAGPLKQIGITLQLADRSIVYSKSMLKDVFVQVEKLIFPAYFFILVMEDDSSSNSTDLLLRRPFLSLARTKIDVYEGTLTMEFDGEKVKFNAYNAMKYSNDNFSLCNIDIVNPLNQEAFGLSKEDKLEAVLTENLTMGCLDNSTSQFSEEII
ncbi:uncharacterized protein LOC122723456 [Manihot esculenta]|uniref:uncharacterized protein LOC122723456 n=1 Tax=Manihot esculenta TaxID=3983 RepID=UPI001CC375DB|nr:uncharacterized protein LOC122723456 [Manihot esculenta]